MLQVIVSGITKIFLKVSQCAEYENKGEDTKN